MPATRRPRTSTGPLQKGSQKTLSFGPSKAGKTTSTKDNLHSPSPLSLSKPSSDIEIEVKPEDDDTDTKPSIKIKTEEEEIHKVEPVRQLSAAQEKASKVTDQQIKKYWKARQDERITPRVHQADLSLEEKVLRLWDMSSSFGVRPHLPPINPKNPRIPFPLHFYPIPKPTLLIFTVCE